MTTLSFPVPDSVNGIALTNQLASAGFEDAAVSVLGEELYIYGLPEDVDKTVVNSIVNKHSSVAEAEEKARVAASQKELATRKTLRGRVLSAKNKGGQRTPEENAALLNDLAELVLQIIEDENPQ